MNPLPPIPNIPPAKVPFSVEERRMDQHDYPLPEVKSKGKVECLCCHEWLPYDQFTELTDPFCGNCRSGNAERELNEIRARQCQRFSQQLVGRVEGRAPLEHVEQFLAELMYNFGGMRVFVKCWSDQLKVGFEQRPGSKGNLDQCKGIAKLVMDTNKLQHQENVLDLSDEQLRVEKELALMQMLSDSAVDPGRRQLLMELIRSGGMQVQDIPGIAETVNA